jgi:hypothetical protein
MIAGHLGIAFAARARAPGVPLAWLLAASVSPDVVDYAFFATGTCNLSGAYSHSLAAIAVAGGVLGAAAVWRTGSARAGLWVMAMVLLHLAADFVTGGKLLWPAGPTVGLRAYDLPALDFFLELPITIGGWWMLRRTSGAPRWAVSLPTLAILLLAQSVADFGGYRKPSACVAHAGSMRSHQPTLALDSRER